MYYPFHCFSALKQIQNVYCYQESKGTYQANGTPGVTRSITNIIKPHQDDFLTWLFLLNVIYQISNDLSNWLDLSTDFYFVCKRCSQKNLQLNDNNDILLISWLEWCPFWGWGQTLFFLCPYFKPKSCRRPWKIWSLTTSSTFSPGTLCSSSRKRKRSICASGLRAFAHAAPLPGMFPAHPLQPTHGSFST